MPIQVSFENINALSSTWLKTFFTQHDTSYKFLKLDVQKHTIIDSG